MWGSGEGPASLDQNKELAQNIPSFELARTHFTSQAALGRNPRLAVSCSRWAGQQSCVCVLSMRKELLSNAEGMDEVTQDLATSNLGGLGAGAAETGDGRPACVPCVGV